MTVADVVTAKIASKTKLQDIEGGVRPVKLPDAWALCRLYGCDTATTDRIAELAMNTAKGGWWEDHSAAMPSWFGLYVELEAAATRARFYDSELVPGLLQAPLYQRAMFETLPDFTEEYAASQVRLRSERQQAALERTPPLRLAAVLGEEALTRPVGGAKGLTEQKAHLLKLSRKSNVTVRVLPWEAGAHLATKGAFNILDFESVEEPSVVYLETYVGGRYVEDEKMLSDFQRMFQTVSGKSVPIEEYLK